MSKTAEEKEILKVWYSRNPVHEINASLRSKELQEDLRVTENVKLSYLEAYNRECKRVDELTEELAKIRGSLIISNNSAKRRGEKITELEGLLKNISEEIHDKPGLYRAWTLINKALGK